MKATAVIDIGGTSIKYGLVSGDGQLHDLGEVPTLAKEGTARLMNRVVDVLQAMPAFERIGISTCGQVNRQDGSIIHATDNIPGYTGTPVGNILREVFHVPVAVENDVNAAAVGEAYFGAAQAYRNFLCLTYGTGIGGAILYERLLYTGRKGSAGEFGHMITHKDGLPCTCGGRGCYEAYASTGALIRMVEAYTGELLDGREIFARLLNADQSLLIVVDAWIDEIICGLVSLIHSFDPECIVLGGGIMTQPYLLAQLRDRIADRVMTSFRFVELLPAQLGNTAGLMGAYYLASQQADTI